MADGAFDRDRFAAALGAVPMGTPLELREATDSTNDDAWAALAAGGPDGLAVVALDQRRGRGRAGRTWTQAPGLGLALSIGLRLGAEARSAGAIPLAAGLAIADVLATLGVAPRLKWPNDVLVNGRKVAGVLCEMRRLPSGDAVVAGLGVNVAQRAEDFPPGLREAATSLAREGVAARLDDVAEAVCTAFAGRIAQLRAGDRATVLAAWSERAAFWGEPVTVRGPASDMTGVAQRLDDSGALVLRLESGAEWTAVAGDLVPGAAAAETR